MFSCLFLSTYYSSFLSSFYERNPFLLQAPYKLQLNRLLKERFGESDAYSRGLACAGWTTWDVIMNCSILNQMWALENDFSGNDIEIIIEQIRRLKPQVVYIHDLNACSRNFLIAIRPYTQLLVGQIATVITTGIPFGEYDIIFSSFPHYVERFRKSGLTAYYQPLAFDSQVLKQIEPPNYSKRKIECSFVGGISQLHAESVKLLKTLAEELSIRIWGYGADTLPVDSPIRTRHHGEAWGKEMFSILASSKITINRHGEVARTFANNMRLFEATGCGALLVTDYKDNLNELFDIGNEIAAYRSPEECVALIKYYLANPKEAQSISEAGQARTLRDHTYEKRMEETSEILTRHLRYKRKEALWKSRKVSKISYGHERIDAD